MRALVKAEPSEGLVMRDEPVPEIGPDDVLVKVREDRHLRHRHPHLELGRVGAEDHSGADDRRPRILRARSSRSAAMCAP